MDYSLPGTSVHGIFQARMLEWVAFYFSRESSQPKDWTHISWVVGRFFTAGSLRKPLPNLIVSCPLSTSARSNSSMHPSFFSTFRKNPSAEENIHKSNPSHWELALEAATKKRKNKLVLTIISVHQLVSFRFMCESKYTSRAYNLEPVKSVSIMGPFVPVLSLLTSSFLMLPPLLSSLINSIKTCSDGRICHIHHLCIREW